MNNIRPLYHFLVNIGLNESPKLGGTAKLSSREALETFGGALMLAYDLAGGQAAITAKSVHLSDTEDTLILRVAVAGDPDVILAATELAAYALRQEAIAIAMLDADLRIVEGLLIGEHAADWGNFNPEFFLMLDGSRAATPAIEFAEAA